MVRPQGVRKGGGRKGETAEGNRTLVTSVISSWKWNIKKKKSKQNKKPITNDPIPEPGAFRFGHYAWQILSNAGCERSLGNIGLFVRNSERCELHFLGQISARVLKQPHTDPVSHFTLRSSSLLAAVVERYLVWIVHPFSLWHFPLYLATEQPLGPYSAGPPLQEQWRAPGKGQRKACGRRVPSHPKAGPVFPSGERKAAAAITQLDFSRRPHFTAAFWGEGEGSHGPRGLVPQGV